MKKSLAELLKIFPYHIAFGEPSPDTLKNYSAGLKEFFAWCSRQRTDPLEVTEGDAFLYLRELRNKKYSVSTIRLKLAILRKFYRVACRQKMVTTNPFEEVRIKNEVKDDTKFQYLDSDEVYDLVNFIMLEPDEYIRCRNLAIIMLMAVEGLRAVEVHRLSDEDINFDDGVIYVRGKGHNDYIYPCDDTLNVLRKYLSVRPVEVIKDELTPVFISVSKCANEFGRISRDGLRWIVNQILQSAGKKKKGSACHLLRHSCGTNLYRETKDLRLVQETLRQRSPSVTARYAHVVDRVASRKTSIISPFN